MSNVLDANSCLDCVSAADTDSLTAASCAVFVSPRSTESLFLDAPSVSTANPQHFAVSLILHSFGTRFGTIALVPCGRASLEGWQNWRGRLQGSPRNICGKISKSTANSYESGYWHLTGYRVVTIANPRCLLLHFHTFAPRVAAHSAKP